MKYTKPLIKVVKVCVEKGYASSKHDGDKDDFDGTIPPSIWE